MALPLIGLIGRKRTGKGAVAAALAARHGYNPVSFADPLRDFVASFNPIVAAFDDRVPDEVPLRFNEAITALGYEVAKDTIPEVRFLLQDIGTNGVRDTLGERYGLRKLLDNDVWPAIAELRIESAIDHVSINPAWQYEGQESFSVVHWREALVFDDVRFRNEAELIKRHGGVIVRVARPSLPSDPDVHPSETAMDGYVEDYTLANDGTLDDLAVAVDTLVAKLVG